MHTMLKWLIGGLVVVTATAAGHAEPAVVFSDGRSLLVEGVERAGDIAYLTLESGGRIGVPAGQILNWNDLAESSETKPQQATSGESADRRLAVTQFGDLVERAARSHGLDPSLLMAVIDVGSGFDPLAVTPRGACGLTQLMPETAKRLGVDDLFDPSQNVEGGAKYLSALLARYEGRTDLALAAFRAGVDEVNQHRGIPPYRKTSRYVNRVLESASQFAAFRP